MWASQLPRALAQRGGAPARRIAHVRVGTQRVEELPPLEELPLLADLPASAEEMAALRFDLAMLLGTVGIVAGTGYLYLYEFGYRRRRCECARSAAPAGLTRGSPCAQWTRTTLTALSTRLLLLPPPRSADVWAAFRAETRRAVRRLCAACSGQPAWAGL